MNAKQCHITRGIGLCLNSYFQKYRGSGAVVEGGFEKWGVCPNIYKISLHIGAKWLIVEAVER